MLNASNQTDIFSSLVLGDIAHRLNGTLDLHSFQAHPCTNVPLLAWCVQDERVEIVVEGAVDMLFSVGNGSRGLQRLQSGQVLRVMANGWNLPCAEAAKTLSICWHANKLVLSYNHWQDGRCISLAKGAMPENGLSTPLWHDIVADGGMLGDVNRLLGAISADLSARVLAVSKQKHLFHQILTFIRCHFFQSICRDSVAAHFCISASYLSHLFQRYSQIGFNEYINVERFAHARHLLLGKEMRVKQVAFESGFVDADYFCRMFKRDTGVTPTQFRQQYVNAEGMAFT